MWPTLTQTYSSEFKDPPQRQSDPFDGISWQLLLWIEQNSNPLTLSNTRNRQMVSHGTTVLVGTHFRALRGHGVIRCAQIFYFAIAGLTISVEYGAFDLTMTRSHDLA